MLSAQQIQKKRERKAAERRRLWIHRKKVGLLNYTMNRNSHQIAQDRRVMKLKEKKTQEEPKQ